jgi:serine/threonine protein kinase
MIGTRLAQYEITSHLGSGGMGDVYQAADTRLGRNVALKFLPEAFAGDADRVARFEREARVLAALNHPNIAAIYGLEESGGRKFLIMELVPGETLAQRIARGAIPLDESLSIASQIADALEAAHESGVVHRDLKPANVKLTADGRVKVLDFGLAKMIQESSSANLSNAPTMATASTPGAILGTAAYMSPEQARGKPTDARSDIWAFGVVLYEMVTGARLFDGETISDTLAAVLTREPDISRAPAKVQWVLRRCLVKDPKRRLRAIGEAMAWLEVPAPQENQGSSATTGGSRRKERVLLGTLAVFVLLAVLAIALVRRPAATPQRASEVRLEINTPPTSDAISFAISPDGKTIVFSASSEGRSQLWIRPIDSLTARPLEGTTFGRFPFWSPDSRSIAFFAEGKLKRINIDGTSPQTLASAPGSFCAGAWNREGVILFTPIPVGPILQVSASGGDAVPATAIDAAAADDTHWGPRFLPDGQHFLYYTAEKSSGGNSVYVGQLGRPEFHQKLLDADATALYVSDHVLFIRQGRLFAQKFDATRLELSGDPIPIAEGVAYGAPMAAMSASDNGIIVYRRGQKVDGGDQSQFAWFDRSGREIEKIGNAGDISTPSLSPDGRWLAVFGLADRSINIWLLDLLRNGVATRFTLSEGADVFPVWSPDGNRIAFASTRKGRHDLYIRPFAASGNEDVLFADAQDKFPSDWSSDGKFLVFSSIDPKTFHDIWALPINEAREAQGRQAAAVINATARTPIPIVQTRFPEFAAQFSPDGKWIVFQSDESGRFEIYAQPFPGPGARVKISTNGGAQPRWRHDGNELFYIALDGKLMAVPVKSYNPASAGLSPDAGTPAPLFQTRISNGIVTLDGHQYVVAQNGQRFLINTLPPDTTTPITVILNWRPNEFPLK